MASSSRDFSVSSAVLVWMFVRAPSLAINLMAFFASRSRFLSLVRLAKIGALYTSSASAVRPSCSGDGRLGSWSCSRRSSITLISSRRAASWRVPSSGSHSAFKSALIVDRSPLWYASSNGVSFPVFAQSTSAPASMRSWTTLEYPLAMAK